MSLSTDPRQSVQRLDAGLALLDRRLLRCLLCFGIVLIGLFNALPHLHEAIWQDEAATLEFHASHGMLHPFLHYGTPNNHIAFSSMLAGWRSLLANPLEPASLRLLPLGLFLLAIAATFVAARQLGGTVCALIAALLFAASPVSGNFATQLRGYGPSWLFLVLAFACALRVLDKRAKWVYRGGYFLASLVAVSILPTNVFLATTVGAAAAAFLLLDPAHRDAEGLGASAVLLLAPAAGLLLAYAAVWDVLMYSRGVVESPWTRAELLGDWWRGSLWDYRWFLPLAGAGLLLGAFRALRGDTDRDQAGSREWTLSLFLLAALPLALVAMPTAPFPRTLVPYLPLWYCALGFFASHWLRLLARGARPLLCFAALAACALPLALADNARACRGDAGSGAVDDYDLCHQYFRDRYHPAQVIGIWIGLHRADVPIATNFEGYHALRALDSNARVFEYRHFPPNEGAVPLLVATDAGEMHRMTAKLGLEDLRYEMVADTGYFKVYAPGK